MTTHNGDYAQASGGKISARPTARSPLATATPSDEWLKAQARQLLEGLPKPKPAPAPKPKPKAPPIPPKPATAKPHPHQDNMARINELLAQLEADPRYRRSR